MKNQKPCQISPSEPSKTKQKCSLVIKATLIWLALTGTNISDDIKGKNWFLKVCKKFFKLNSEVIVYRCGGMFSIVCVGTLTQLHTKISTAVYKNIV